MRAPARYSVMDLFAGCGGLSRGLHDSGRFDTVFAVESDKDAARTFTANFANTEMRVQRIEDVADFPLADVVVGGPPCQGFSTLNRDGVGLERRKLWRQYLRALDTSGARAFVMEQVPQLRSTTEYKALRREVRRRGFEVEARVLNAADFGVPQKRKRVFVIGICGAEPKWPNPTHRDPKLSNDLPPWRTFGDAVSDLPATPTGRDWHNPRRPRPESLVRYAAVPPNGGNRFEMQRELDERGLGHLVLPCFRRKPSGTTDVFGRLWWDRPAVTIRTEFFKPEKGRYLHPTEDRAITVREAARCMSFPDDFVLPLDQSMTSIARQIGNAVPPMLAQRVAATLASQLDELAADRRAA